MALGFDEMNHCHVSLPWGGRSSRLTSFEPHSNKSRPQANLPIMVVGLPGEALPLVVDRQESIWLLCCPNASKASPAARDCRNASRICLLARAMNEIGDYWPRVFLTASRPKGIKVGYTCLLSGHLSNTAPSRGRSGS